MSFSAREPGACKISFGDAALQSPIAEGHRKPRNSGAARAGTPAFQTRSARLSTHKNVVFAQTIPVAISRSASRRTTVRSSLRIFVGLNALAENRRIMRELSHPPMGKLTLEKFHNSVSRTEFRWSATLMSAG